MRLSRLPSAAGLLTTAIYLGLVIGMMLVLHGLIRTLPVHILGYVVIGMVAFAFGMTAGERSAVTGMRTVRAHSRRRIEG
jgi:hypothetical protein